MTRINESHPNENEQNSTPRVTDHAKLRFRQRVDPGEPFPGERIRELFSKGIEVAEKYVDEGRGRLADGYLIVYKEGAEPVITTVLDGREVPVDA